MLLSAFSEVFYDWFYWLFFFSIYIQDARLFVDPNKNLNSQKLINLTIEIQGKK